MLNITKKQFAIIISIIAIQTMLIMFSFFYEDVKSANLKSFQSEVTLLKAQLQEKEKERLFNESIANAAMTQLTTATAQIQILKSRLKQLDAPLPWKPTTTLALWQEKKCMAILLFGEDRASEVEGLVKIANVVDNRVKHEKYQSNACKVAAEGFGVQFSSMKPYLGRINSIVWGGSQDYVPTVAKQNAIEMKAWNRIVKLVDEIYAGEHYLLTDATHFLAPTGITRMPGWAKAFRPVDVSTGHVFFIDHEYRDGKIVYYTKDKPFNQAKFNGVHK